jgi:2-polyprenyl-3-methyl-5-hydroxy-6-metoxy-1,4-benzoquinol methylase
MFNQTRREKKAITMVTIIEECSDTPLKSQTVLNVGGSAGIIDNYLSSFFKQVTGIDIDENAISFAKESFKKSNLIFETGDAMTLRYDSDSLFI